MPENHDQQQADSPDIDKQVGELSKLLSENVNLLVKLSLNSETLVDDVKDLNSSSHLALVEALKNLSTLEQYIDTVKGESSEITENFKRQLEEFSSSGLLEKFRMAVETSTENLEEAKKETKSTQAKLKRLVESNAEKIDSSQKAIDETFVKFNQSMNERFKQFDSFLPAVSKKLALLGIGFFLVTSIIGGAFGFLTAHTFTKKGIVDQGINESAEIRDNLLLLHEYGITPAIYQDTQGRKFIQIKGVNTLGMPIKNSSGNYSIPIER